MLLLAACTFGEVTVPRGEPVVVVHAVLNPQYLEQVILVERALTGRVTIDTLSPFDPADPVRTGRGVPVSGAQVVLRGAGLEVMGREDRSPSSVRGAGVYRLALDTDNPLRPGQRYTLTVTTTDGEVVRGSTTIPAAAPVPEQPALTPFDRDADTLHVGWEGVVGARSYLLFAESPFGAFTLFVDSLQVRLAGTVRNIFANEIPHVFLPGFQQEVMVAAVDTNYYDYYRSRNDPFTGSGIVNHLEGGVGLVGSLVPVARRTVDVRAAMRAPIEGHYLHGNDTQGFLGAITLYLESPSVGGSPAALSGAWFREGSDAAGGFIGTLQGTQVRMALLNEWSANDTLLVISAQWRGDSLVGRFDRGGEVVMVKR